MPSFLSDQPGLGPRKVIVSPFLYREEDETGSGLGVHRVDRRGAPAEYADDGADITRNYRLRAAAAAARRAA
jgi:hypothetical protein